MNMKIQRLGIGFLTFLFLGCVLFSAGIFFVGCEDDSGDEPVGTSIIQGNVDSFETSVAVSRVLAAVAGVVVYLDGPVSRSTTTDTNGNFTFTELPAGDYTLRFEYNGEEVTYRGESGQTASITLESNQMVELTGMRISGGQVNIGNIRVLELDESGQPIEPEPEPQPELASTIWYSGATNITLGLYQITDPPEIPFDVNCDETPDFIFYKPIMDVEFEPQSSNRATGPLASGVLINSESEDWFESRQLLLRKVLVDDWGSPDGFYETYFGMWSGVTNGYMGLEFRILSVTHYGWAHISHSSVDVTLRGWAYETRPGVGIRAGQTE